MRPNAQEGAPSESLDERQQRVLALASQLNSDVPAEIGARSEEQQARWLLAALLDWHRREDKADWWEFFRLRELSDEDLLDENAAISGLEYTGRVDVSGKLPVDRYQFAKQDTDVRVGDELLYRGEKVGTAFALDLAARNLDIKKMKKTADTHPTSVFTFSTVNSRELAESLYRLGSWVLIHRVDAPGTYRAARDLLLRRSPRIVGAMPHVPLIRERESTLDMAKRIGVSLDSSILAVQGPPGAGKTYTGARMICEALRRGQKVGITAASHKVIRNLLEEVVKAAGEETLSGLCCVQKVSEKSDPAPTSIKEVTDNASALEALQGASGQVLAGTAWLWSREEFFETVDILFIDEAGQMSLANVLAVAQAARNVVLLGDPQQLEQPLRSSHPDGAEASALEHLLAGAKTIAPDRGLFLEETWRLHPSICRFTSELFYDSRLKSRPGLEKQSIVGHPWLDRHGLWLLPVNHEGNQSASQEEVDRVAEVVQSLLLPGVSWIDHNGNIWPLKLHDILIVAPYNAQVSDLSGRLPGARVGTVDKFQGQEAPVVIYSLTTSSPEEAPRGMEFLYNLNRLNVATSRARAACLLIASPRLFEPECRTPRQMQLANGLCRYLEMAKLLDTTT